MLLPRDLLGAVCGYLSETDLARVHGVFPDEAVGRAVSFYLEREAPKGPRRHVPGPRWCDHARMARDYTFIYNRPNIHDELVTNRLQLCGLCYTYALWKMGRPPTLGCEGRRFRNEVIGFPSAGRSVD
jgi:hypothetical protein